VTAASKVQPRLKNGSIHVCPLSAVADTVARCNAGRLLTCLNDVVVETPALIKAADHLRLAMHDINEPLEGYIAPDEGHVERLIDFALDWGGSGPMVVHCYAGISRSTAAAFISLCAINEEVPEALIARHLREASPTAFPNRLLVRLADDALGRDGRMLEAIEAIGRGVIVSQAVPFSMAADLAPSSVRR
jgi:predicted protein tyrosine phosphatase